MKRVSKIVVAALVVCASLIMISLAASSAGKKDQNCINRCASDYRMCLKKARGFKYKDRIAAGNVCIREKNTCIALCPDAMHFQN